MDRRFYVPCCPTCAIPLRPAEGDPTRGTCPSIHCPHKSEPFGPGTWRWIHQDVFNQSELPPFNGWEQVVT